MKSLLLLLTLTVLAVASCDPGPVVHEDPPFVQRTLSISASPRLDPPPTLDDFIDAEILALEAGVSGSFFSATWSKLEPAAGASAYEDTLVRDIKDAAMNGQFVLLGIQIVNTTAKETPADLRSLAFDDPQMRERFRALIDRLVSRFDRGDVVYLSIGNEVDVYFASHPNELAAYKTFFAEMVQYVHSKSSVIQVGVTITHAGMISADSTRLRELASIGDVVIGTYYPIDASFGVHAPTSPLVDLPRMARFVPSKQLVLQEVGYPSSTLLGSSEEKQSEFMSSVFNAWFQQRAAIPFLNVFLMHDLTHDMCEAFAVYYGLPNSERFKAFLCSLGLRATNGRPKPAWEVFAKRGREVG